MTSDDEYPDHLNPFGADDEEPLQQESPHNTLPTLITSNLDDYPDHLSPFGAEHEDGEAENSSCTLQQDDYDNSLNPFDCETDEADTANGSQQVNTAVICSNDKSVTTERCDRGDPSNENSSANKLMPSSEATNSQPASLDIPPVPLPRTKSLLKKELALKKKQSRLVANGAIAREISPNNDPASSAPPQNMMENEDLKSVNRESTITNVVFEKKKNKRNAPPVPVNYKRQVLGSLEEIEEELNDIGDKLGEIEKEFCLCQEALKESHKSDLDKFSVSKDTMVKILDRKSSISRRQRELMYRKRELKLDQIHSDIEYELRMIGNKQRKYRS